MNNNSIDQYLEYVNKVGRRLNLYRKVANEFSISSALYPGSHIDIDPSLVIPKVTYVDNFKGTIRFFNNIITINEYLDAHKEYREKCILNFIPDDYNTPFELDSVDLIISQFAGFVGQATKKYLKKGGILLCNDSHGDATLAFLDNDFEFIATIDRNDNINYKNLDKFFSFKMTREIDETLVKSKMKGPKYKNMAQNYIFQKK